MFEELFHEAVNRAKWQLIVPGEILRKTIGSDAQRLADANAGISLIVAAGPYRLNLTSVEFSSETQALFPQV